LGYSSSSLDRYAHSKLIKGDRIAQLIIQQYASDWMEVSEFDDTDRGSGSFGSTGK
jgi:dUTPase